MSVKKKILRVFAMLIMVVCLGGLVALTNINSNKQQELICSNVDIQIDHERDLFFIDNSDIQKLLFETFGDSVRGDRIREIETGRMEKIIEKDPYVEDAELWLDANGIMHIKIVQKQPLARVINRYGVNYYIDDHSEKIPVSDKFTSRVPVVTGSIAEDNVKSDKIESTALKQVLQLIRFIHANTFWNAQIEQVDVADDGTFELVPKLGDHIIEFGGIENMQEKFTKLEIFYKDGLSYVGWDKYSKIKLDYKGQIVCEKKDTL